LTPLLIDPLYQEARKRKSGQAKTKTKIRQIMRAKEDSTRRAGKEVSGDMTRKKEISCGGCLMDKFSRICCPS
jgi:hypothetical protein